MSRVFPNFCLIYYNKGPNTVDMQQTKTNHSEIPFTYGIIAMKSFQVHAGRYLNIKNIIFQPLSTCITFDDFESQVQF